MRLSCAGFGLRTAATLQVALAAMALCALAFAPPAHGRTLLIPVDGKPIDRSVLDRAMLLRIGDGPLPGSIVVDGPGRDVAGSLFQKGIVMLAAPAALCSERVPQEGEK